MYIYFFIIGLFMVIPGLSNELDAKQILINYKSKFEIDYATRCINPKCEFDYSMNSKLIGPITIDKINNTVDLNLECNHNIYNAHYKSTTISIKTSKENKEINEQICVSKNLEEQFKLNRNFYEQSITFLKGAHRTYPGKRDTSNHDFSYDDKFLNGAFGKRSCVIIGDLTGSNAFNNHFNRHIDQLNDLLNYFNEKDELGWVSIGHNQISIPIRQSDIENKTNILNTVKYKKPYGYGDFYKALTKAYHMLNYSNNKLKSIILITDGHFTEIDERIDQLIQNITDLSVTIHVMNINSNSELTEDYLKILACSGSGTYNTYYDKWYNMLEIFEAESGDSIPILSEEILSDGSILYSQNIAVHDINFQPERFIGVISISTHENDLPKTRSITLLNNNQIIVTYTYNINGNTYRVIGINNKINSCHRDNLRTHKCGIEQCIPEITNKVCDSNKFQPSYYKSDQWSEYYSEDIFNSCKKQPKTEICQICANPFNTNWREASLLKNIPCEKSSCNCIGFIDVNKKYNYVYKLAFRQPLRYIGGGFVLKEYRENYDQFTIDACKYKTMGYAYDSHTPSKSFKINSSTLWIIIPISSVVLFIIVICIISHYNEKSRLGY